MKRITKLLISKWHKYKPTFLWLIEQSKETKQYILAFLLINLAGMLLSVASPVASKYVVDAAIGYNRDFQIWYVLIMLATSMASILVSIVSNIYSSYANEKYAFSVRARMFDRVQRQAWKRISDFHSGDLISRLVGDVDTIATNLISILPNLIVTGIQLVIVLVIVLVYDPVIAMIGLILGPLGILLSLVLRKPFQECQAELRKTQSEYYTFFQESFSNISVVKSFQMEEDNSRYFESVRNRRMDVILRSAKIRALMFSSTGIVFRIGYLAAFCWCAYKITVDPTYTYGTMTLFLSLVSMLQGSIRGLGEIVPKFYTMVVCAKRVREITEQEPEDYSGEDREIPNQVGVRLKQVAFRYENETILDHVSLDVRPNMHIGIVGTSGAGKTTLIRLLLSLISPDEGEVEYYNEEGFLEKAAPATRRMVSYVPQGNTLFTGTVRENLRFGNPDATEEMMWEALDAADAAGFVRKHKDGLDMPIQERSSGMSAGQAQRICIARALLRDRPVLIFDEATSALDEPTEKRIFERIIQKCNKTCFVITHRSSMLVYCDRVYEIHDDGTITMRET